MVPLTPSLYVPGQMINNDEFLLDIGTGFYIERDRKSTESYFDRKVKFLNEQIDIIIKSLQEKIAFRQALIQRQQELIVEASKQQSSQISTK